METPILADLLTAETVRAKVQVVDWEAATDMVGGLLLSQGTIEKRYIDGMKRVFREMGPYAVIGPGIALLHARPDDGVLSPTFGLLTLEEPIPFGHPDHDPVDIVFAFGTTSAQAHVEALRQLALLLSNPEALARIRSSISDSELLSSVQFNG